MEDWIKDVTYILMPSAHPVKGYEKEYFAAYAVWRAAWEKFYSELGVDHPLDSDAFVIPDEMGVIFYKGECVGLCSFTHGNLTPWDVMKDMSWFKSWTPDAFQKLRDISTKCMICSQFTIAPKFAGKEQIVRWKDILFLYLFQRLEYSDYKVMAGHLNVSKGMNKAGGKDHGTTVLDAEHHFMFHGRPQVSQLVAFEQKYITEDIEKKNLRPLCDALWSRLTHLTDYSVTKYIGDTEKKKAA